MNDALVKSKWLLKNEFYLESRKECESALNYLHSLIVIASKLKNKF